MIGVLILFFFSPISQTIFRLKKWRSKGTYFFFHTKQVGCIFMLKKFFFKFSEIFKLFCYFCKLFSEMKFIMKKLLLGLLLITLFLIGLLS